MKKPFLETKRADWGFIILATIVWASALLITAWDFAVLQKSIYHFSIFNLLGLTLAVIGVSIRIIARKTLGKYFFHGLKTSSEHKLVIGGIYKYIRHPAYLGSILFNSGVPLIFSSVYGFLVMWLWFVPLLFYRIRIEEDMLIARFGEEYRRYMKQTKKIIPFLY